MNYYQNRSQAGIMLADQLKEYKHTSCAVVALSQGAVVVGEEIAKATHGTLFCFASQQADDQSGGDGTAIGSGGAFSFNTAFTLGQLEEEVQARQFFTSKRNMDEYQRLNHIAGKDGVIPKALLKRHVVILVSDGFRSALSLQIAVEFLRGVDIKKLIVATPIASGEAIDKMHILVDQIICLRSVENYISISHYYEENDIPDDKTVVDIMKNIVLNWPHP